VKITHRQRQALSWLNARHIQYPNYPSFGTVHLGESTTALLRRLAPLGLVDMTKGGAGRRQFFAITDAGKATLEAA